MDSSQFPSPATGRIIGTTQRVLLGNGQIVTVVLETDPSDQDTGIAPLTQVELVRSMLNALPKSAPQAALERLASAGVQADRWTSPDLIAQLQPLARKQITVVLCGVLDLDPALPLQQTLLAEYPMDVAAGVAALARLTGAGQALIALPEDSPAAIVGAMKAAAAASATRLYPLPNEYPLANPSLLIRRVLGRKLSPGRLPTEVGVLLLDAPAAVAVGRCFLHNEPMLRVPLGIYDPRQPRTHLVSAPIGAGLIDVLRELEIATEDCDMRAGQILRDVTVSPEAIVGHGELTVFAATPHSAHQASACLRCGWCIEACPVRIHPAGLLEAAQQEDPEMARRYGIAACIECGICSYVCPSRLPLLEAIRGLRAKSRGS